LSNVLCDATWESMFIPALMRDANPVATSSKRAGEYVHRWGVILDEKARAFETERKGAGIKRERNDEDDGGPKKKARPAHSAQSLDGMSITDLRAAIAAGNLQKFVVADLKEWLNSRGLSSSGKKADLVERIEQWVENA